MPVHGQVLGAQMLALFPKTSQQQRGSNQQELSSPAELFLLSYDEAVGGTFPSNSFDTLYNPIKALRSW